MLCPFSGPALWPKLLFSSLTEALKAVTNDDTALLMVEALCDTVTVLSPACNRLTVKPGATVTAAVSLEMGVARLREHSLAAQRRLVELLAERRVAAEGGSDDRGAFVIVTHPRAANIADALRRDGIATDARGTYVRLCPDVLTTETELVQATSALAAAVSRF